MSGTVVVPDHDHGRGRRRASPSRRCSMPPTGPRRKARHRAPRSAVPFRRAAGRARRRGTAARWRGAAAGSAAGWTRDTGQGGDEHRVGDEGPERLSRRRHDDEHEQQARQQLALRTEPVQRAVGVHVEPVGMDVPSAHVRALAARCPNGDADMDDGEDAERDPEGDGDTDEAGDTRAEALVFDALHRVTGGRRIVEGVRLLVGRRSPCRAATLSRPSGWLDASGLTKNASAAADDQPDSDEGSQGDAGGHRQPFSAIAGRARGAAGDARPRAPYTRSGRTASTALIVIAGDDRFADPDERMDTDHRAGHGGAPTRPGARRWRTRR